MRDIKKPHKNEHNQSSRSLLIICPVEVKNKYTMDTCVMGHLLHALVSWLSKTKMIHSQ